MSDAELTIDGHELLNCLATGNASQVWEAMQTSSGKTFAMKLLLPETLVDAEQRKMLKHEASVAKQLEHPNIISYVDSKVSKKQAYYTMELFRSTNLKSLIRNDLHSVHVRMKKLMECCSQAFAYMHEKKWIHKDIKPDNILLTKAGEVRVIDFSLASRGGSSVGHMMTRKSKINIQGTRTYIAPELIRREKLTPSADIYSLGILFYEAFTGRPPFMGSNPNDLLMMHVRDRADVPSSYHPNVSPAADALVMRMLSKQPKDRHESMQEVFSEVRSMKLFKEDPENYYKKATAAAAAELSATVDQRLNSRADAILTAEHGHQPRKAPPPKPKPAPAAVEKPAATPAQPVAQQPTAPPTPPQQPQMPQPVMPQQPVQYPHMQPMPQQPMMPPQPGVQYPMVPGMMPPGQYPPMPPGQYPQGVPGQYPQMPPGVQYPAQPSPPQQQPAQAPDPPPVGTPQPPADPQPPVPVDDPDKPDDIDWINIS